MLVEVAMGPGPQFPAVLDQPYALTLWTYYQITERERIHELQGRFRAQREAELMSIAFNDPKLLRDERATLESEARHHPSTRDSERAAFKARGLALAERIEATGVLDD